ncbi:MAG: DUF2914 domain-containing protein [Deltaproteobacteria bacterium]|nr:DUF2914 domain-containing protein [Deltaproteobacteria bacterium]
MQCFARCLLYVSVIVLVPCQILALEKPLAVTEMSITTRIVRGSPVDSVQRISSSAIQALYCYTKIAASDEEGQEIVHVWYRNNEIISRRVLPIQGTSWRTYSKIYITRKMSGDWRVEVLDRAGNLLRTSKFRLN